MTGIEYLSWIRGPGFNIAIAVFILGISVRILEIIVLGRKKQLAVTRAGKYLPGLRTIISRSVPDKGTLKREPLTIINGYIFHIGFFIVLLLFAPHIELFQKWLGLSWPSLPTPIVDAAAIVTMMALVLLLVTRFWNPVRRFLSRSEDYFVWLVTFLPLLTGYMAYHRLGLPYHYMLGTHILSIELLLVVFPFTKLMHTFTLLLARWYNGVISGAKGVQL